MLALNAALNEARRIELRPDWDDDFLFFMVEIALEHPIRI
jgi:hypothetical protein